jgi:hypothetical protein
MSEGTFENDGDEAEGLATGAGPTQSRGEQQRNQGDGPEQDGDTQDDLENKAEELDVDLEPPSS